MTDTTVIPGDLPRNLTAETVPDADIMNVPVVRRPGSKEVATLEVRGQLYTNWTSVRVEQRWTEAFPVFQFEATEETPVPLTVIGAQFVPGDIVRVLLGGYPAVFGYITERHVAYEGSAHGIKLIGCGDTVDLVESTVPLEKLGGHDGQSVTELAREISAHLGTMIRTTGAVDMKPYDNIQVIPGETIMQTIERYARPRNIVIGSAANGGLLLIGEHPARTSGHLWEGVNILRANAVYRDNKVYRKYLAVGQNAQNDQSNGDPENKQVAELPGSSTRPREMLVVLDVADTMHGVERRVQMESVFSEGSYIEAHITVQGWFKDSNVSEDLWRAGEYYVVNSPSLILNDELLGCAGCVYEQSSEGGTTTTLQMVKPIHMNGRQNLRDAEIILMQQRQEEQKRREAAAKAAADAAEAAKENSQ